MHPLYVRSDEVGKKITELFGLVTAAEYELLVLIGEFDRDKLWNLSGICSCAHWLNFKCGIGMNAARERVRVANALSKFPLISESFSKGEISYSKVRAMTRVATPENEDFLMNIARHGTAHHVETVVRGYRRATKLNDVESANQQHHSRSFNYYYDDDGSLVIKGRLPSEVGAMLIKALDKAVDRAKREEEDSTVSAETRDHNRPSFSTRRADAIAEMAESYLEQGDQSSSTADRYQVMLHVSAETLRTDVTAETSETNADPITETETSHIEDGSHVSAETSKRICCDTSISRLVEDEKGEPLSIGRKSRVIPPAMRRALKVRDKGCRFPGCTHTYFIDGHHIEHWADGGETSLDNLVLLCRKHHRLVHEGGFGCHRDKDGEIVFTDQIGKPIGEFGQEPPTYLEDFVHKLKEKVEDRHIDSQTCVTQWAGERMDRPLTVELLWYRDHTWH